MVISGSLPRMANIVLPYMRTKFQVVQNVETMVETRFEVFYCEIINRKLFCLYGVLDVGRCSSNFWGS